MPRLVDLDPEWIRWEDRYEGLPTDNPRGFNTFLHECASLAEAQGIEFDCPKCRDHRIHVAFLGRGVLDHHGTRSSDGRPTRWQVVGGTTFDDLSLSPSIDCTPSNPNCWHGHITNGEAT